MRLITVTLWILAGAALTAGAYWSFLITPESTIWMLAVSALLLLTSLFLVGLTVAGAIVGWRHGISTQALRPAIASAPAVLPAMLVIAVMWWLTGRATESATVNSGPIHAWFMATLGWPDVSWLFTAFAWFAAGLKWVVAPMLALSLMGRIVHDGWRAPASGAWLRHALAPINIAVATLLFAGLIAAPWIYLAPWRPASLPATAIELVFIIAKLSVTAVLMAAGAALIVRQAAPQLK